LTKNLIENNGNQMKEEEIITKITEILDTVPSETYIGMSKSHYSAMVSSIRGGKMV
jgi:hypothetical protein